MSDRPDPKANANEPNTQFLSGAGRVLAGLTTVNRILTIWIPATLAVIVLVIGIVTSSVGYIAVAVVLGIVVAYGWVRIIGTRDASNEK